MCIFTHFAAGALAGGATGSAWAAAAAGLVSHALLDLFPHYDFEDWRREVGLGLVPLAALLLTPWASAATVVGGLAACLPDLENLLWKLGRLERRRMVFPTHTGLLPHGAARGPRNLWAQVALAALCLALLPAVAPDRAAAAPGASEAPDGPPQAVFGPAEARLLAGGSDATRIEVRFPVQQPPADWAGVDPQRVRWLEPGPTVTDGTGRAVDLPPERRCLVAVPTLEAPQIAVAEVVWWREPEYPVDPVSLVSVAGPAVFRDVPLAVVRVRPLAPGGGIVARLTLTLVHPPAGRVGLALAAARAERAGGGPAALTFGAGGVLNPALYARIAAGVVTLDVSAARAVAKAAAHPFGLTSHWVRLEVQQTGVYRLTGYDLSLLGVATAQVGAAALRVYRGGGLPQAADPTAPGSWQDDWTGLTEIGVEVREDDGTWDSGDELIFYGVAGDAWRDRYDPAGGRLEHFEHPGSGNGIYWLTWEGPGADSPLPGDPLRVGPAVAAGAGGGQIVTEHRARLHQEQSYEDALGRLGDNWAWDTRILSSTRSLSFNAGTVVPGRDTRFVVDVRGYSERASLSSTLNQATAWLNGDTAHAVTLVWTVGQEDDSLRVRLTGSSAALVSGTNSLNLRNDLGVSGGLDLILDSFDILSWAPLAKSTQAALAFAHWGDQVAAPATAVDLTVSLPDDAAVTVWDVSAPEQPVALAGDVVLTPSPALTLGLSRDPGTDRHFVVFDGNDPPAPPVRARRYPVDLRALLPPLDYVVIHDPLMVSGAVELAALRGDILPGVASPAAAAVSEETIYDNFSGGRKEPWALRNFLKWLYLRDADPLAPETGRRLKYVCLLGDASRDYRNFQQHDPATQPYDFLPTVERTVFPRRPLNSSYSADPYATDDGLVSFDAPTSGLLLDFPDLAVGRLPVRTAAEASAMVRRIRDEVTAPEAGLWRNRVVLVADDLVTPRVTGEVAHTRQAEVLANNYLPPTIDLTKLYLIDYTSPPGIPYKPAARQEARWQWNQGLTMFHYIGHGSENTLADEQVFLTEDIATLTNGARRGIFLAFSCDVGVFESPVSQSMAELFVRQEAGGAIAAIAASQVSFIYLNDLFSSDFYGYLFPARRVDPAQTVGGALLLAKRRLPDPYTGTRYLENCQKYNLFGDPAFRPPQPASSLALTAASADTLHGGALERVVADLGAAGIVPGAQTAYDLRVEESRLEQLIPGSSETYWLPGAPAFRGSGTAAADPLAVPFKVPLQLRYGPRGKVRLIVDTPDGSVATAAIVPLVAAGGAPASDVAGPLIDLAFADGRYRVPPGALLNAAVTDSSGVNILGTNPGNSIVYELDESGFFNDVSASFVFDPGSFTAGRVDITLPGDVSRGSHRLALFASDVLGNVGSDTVSFQVVPAALAGIAGVTVFPNPTPGPCRLLCELSDPMRLEWTVYTVSGRRVWRQAEVFDTPGPKVLHWDGRDDEGDPIANGVYLYVLSGAWEGDEDRGVRETGQIVIMK